MAQFLSPEWVAERNDLLAGVELDDPETAQVLEPSLTAQRRRFRVRQVVEGVPPDGGARILDLVADDTGVRLELVEPRGGAGPEPATATVRLGYADAAALSRGALDPAGALGAGRVKVQGDLALLVAAQGMLSRVVVAGAGHVEDTTY